MAIERAASANRIFAARSIRFCHLFHQEATPVTMWNFMFAKRPGNVMLVQMEQKCLEWHSIELQRDGCNSNEG